MPVFGICCWQLELESIDGNMYQTGSTTREKWPNDVNIEDGDFLGQELMPEEGMPWIGSVWSPSDRAPNREFFLEQIDHILNTKNNQFAQNVAQMWYSISITKHNQEYPTPSFFCFQPIITAPSLPGANHGAHHHVSSEWDFGFGVAGVVPEKNDLLRSTNFLAFLREEVPVMQNLQLEVSKTFLHCKVGTTTGFKWSGQVNCSSVFLRQVSSFLELCLSLKSFSLQLSRQTPGGWRGFRHWQLHLAQTTCEEFPSRWGFWVLAK